MSTTKPHAEMISPKHPLSIVFTDVGIPRLHDAIDAGTVAAIAGEDLDVYATVAAVRLSPNSPPAEAADYFADRIMSAIFPEEYPALDGEVTEESLRHWEWMMMLIRFEESARALLGALPVDRVAAAEGRAASNRGLARRGFGSEEARAFWLHN